MQSPEPQVVSYKRLESLQAVVVNATGKAEDLQKRTGRPAKQSEAQAQEVDALHRSVADALAYHCRARQQLLFFSSKGLVEQLLLGEELCVRFDGSADGEEEAAGAAEEDGYGAHDGARWRGGDEEVLNDEYEASGDHRHGSRRDPSPWFVIEATFAEKLLRLMDQRAPSERRGFVSEVQLRARCCSGLC